MAEDASKVPNVNSLSNVLDVLTTDGVTRVLSLEVLDRRLWLCIAIDNIYLNLNFLAISDRLENL